MRTIEEIKKENKLFRKLFALDSFQKDFSLIEALKKIEDIEKKIDERDK